MTNNIARSDKGNIRKSLIFLIALLGDFMRWFFFENCSYWIGGKATSMIWNRYFNQIYVNEEGGRGASNKEHDRL